MKMIFPRSLGEGPFREDGFCDSAFGSAQNDSILRGVLNPGSDVEEATPKCFLPVILHAGFVGVAESKEFIETLRCHSARRVYP